MIKENENLPSQKSQINISGFNGSRSLLPNTIDEAYRIAQAFSRSDFIPKEYRDKPDNCFTAINLGMEIGLPPMRALQSIAVVNGKPTIYGDAQLALVRSSGLLEIFEESYDGQEGADNFAAICKLKRKSDIEITIEKFSISDAKKAGLWGKAGPWSTHPKRMLRYKARAFALRDKFADVLLGLTHSVEEMEGEQMINVTPSKTSNLHELMPENFDDKFGKEKKQIDIEGVVEVNVETNSNNSQSSYDFEDIKSRLMKSETVKEVNNIVKEANDFVDMNPSNVLELRRIVNGLKENLK